MWDMTSWQARELLVESALSPTMDSGPILAKLVQAEELTASKQVQATYLPRSIRWIVSLGMSPSPFEATGVSGKLMIETNNLCTRVRR